MPEQNHDSTQPQKANPQIIGVARVLTLFLSPAGSTLAAMFIVYKEYLTDTGHNSHLWLVAAVGMVTLSLATIWLFIKLKIVSNFDITQREQRPKVLALLSFYSISIFVITWRMGFIQALQPLFLFVLALSTASLITLFWKISFHTFATTLCIEFIIVTYGHPALYLLLIIPPVVAWTRVYLKKHSLEQVIGGIALGIIMLFVWSVMPDITQYFR